MLTARCGPAFAAVHPVFAAVHLACSTERMGVTRSELWWSRGRRTWGKLAHLLPPDAGETMPGAGFPTIPARPCPPPRACPARFMALVGRADAGRVGRAPAPSVRCAESMTALGGAGPGGGGNWGCPTGGVNPCGTVSSFLCLFFHRATRASSSACSFAKSGTRRAANLASAARRPSILAAAPSCLRRRPSLSPSTLFDSDPGQTASAAQQNGTSAREQPPLVDRRRTQRPSSPSS